MIMDRDCIALALLLSFPYQSPITNFLYFTVFTQGILCTTHRGSDTMRVEWLMNDING
jgi:hypothetical protein